MQQVYVMKVIVLTRGGLTDMLGTFFFSEPATHAVMYG
jgi:hypothetical protein